ncbi:uncharacterized protein LAJ45_07009 [Morchella importuna]|uniref:uncharacterized protein n=1 Tax=Morchella importuna TaxID=1174673 RepID=UPI001E8CDA61|nr:uncharacterized protein LAJ45_07009 [Morchella importuna]KAH8149033.1 hypothetical protein LAJ45_07009 [Morchella importuna]
MLLDITQIPHTSYIVIDGLDECRADDRKRFMTCMNRLMKDSKSRIKIVISSREKVDISRYLVDFKGIPLCSAVNHSDIVIYIRETIEEKLKDVNLKVGPGMVEEINDALIKGSDGMFLWVRFQIIEICRENNDDDIRRVLQTLPKGLDETYLRILKRIVDNHKSDIAKKVFTWLAVARRPIRLTELNEAVAFEPGCSHWSQGSHQNVALNMLRNCGNLIIRVQSDDTIKLAHYTVLELLKSRRAAQSMDFGAAIARIAKPTKNTPLPAVTEWGKLAKVHNRQMGLLSKIHPGLLLHDSIAHVPSARLLGDKTKKEEDLLKEFHLLEYVRQNWIHHCRGLSKEDLENWHLFDSLVFSRELQFNHFPWYQDYPREESFYGDIVLWAAETDNPAVLKAALDRLGDARDRAHLAQGALYLASLKGKKFVIPHLPKLGASLEISPRMLSEIAPGVVAGVVVEAVVEEATQAEAEAEALLIAAGRGHLTTVSRLIECGADVNLSYNQTALETAAGVGYINVVRLLIQNGAQVGTVALEAASSGGHDEIVNFLKVHVPRGAGK